MRRNARRLTILGTLVPVFVVLVACGSSSSQDASSKRVHVEIARGETSGDVRIPTSSEIALVGEVTGLAADGERALIATGIETDELEPLAVFYWDHRSGKVIRHSTSNLGDWAYPALAGRVAAFAWGYEGGGLGESAIGFRVWRPEGPRASEFGWVFSPAAGPLNARGEGQLLVFNTVSRGRPRLWRVRGGGRELLLQGSGARPIVDVDRGRIAIRRGTTVELRDGRGRLRKAITISTNRPRAVALTGDTLVVQDADGLEMYDIASGATLSQWPLNPGTLYEPSELLDAQGDLAVYVVGPAIHIIRLSDGKDITLELGDQTGSSAADLEPAGLFYAYTPTRRTPDAPASSPWRISAAPSTLLQTHDESPDAPGP